MSSDEANDFIPEHLARWRKITREYLLAPVESPGVRSGPGAVSLLPDAKRFRPDTAGSHATWAWLLALGCAWAPVASLAAEPLALQRIMKDMGRNMQVIVDGLSREDYAVVGKAALAIADHPPPPLGEKMRILSFVGGDTTRFKAFDGETHDNAMALAKASKGGNGEDAIAAFHKLQSSCLNCHQAFRKPFVEHFYGKVDVRQ
jgi:cytochrome c556